MHKILSKSPITYVFAQVRFTSIESISKYIPEIQDKIRNDFPQFKEVTIYAIEVRDEQQPIPSTIKQWHFVDKDSVMGIILDGKSISIHTSKYVQFEVLSKKLEKVLKKVNEILHISLLERLGVRYINIIESNLSNFIKEGLLGFYLKGEQFDQNRYIINTDLTQKSDKGLIRVKSACVGDKEIIVGVKNILVPPDLAEAASFLSFTHLKQPTGKFLMLDIDHYEDKKEDFNIEKVMFGLKDLQDAAYYAFQESVTSEALKSWA